MAKRPTDVVGNAVHVMGIATGELRPAQQLGKLGGAARAKKLTPEQRTEIAKKGAQARWAKNKPIS